MSGTVGFQDGNGRLYVGDSDTEIVSMMRDVEWGENPPVHEWKERVRMRASMFGFHLEFHDASSFLDSVERQGLGARVDPNRPRFNPPSKTFKKKP